ncbi:MAG: transcription-repair coupling factor, partial [Solirubrobacterales bacterium]
MLRPLLDIATDDERFIALAAAVRDGGPVDAHASASIRPYLLAALLDSEPGLGGRPALAVAADDVGARDLARALGAYLAPRRVRYYPSRGTGYQSHLAPPPHLVGLRVGALDALTEGAPEEPAVVVASAIALAEAVPDASLRPEGFVLHRGEEVDLADVAELLVEAGYERADQVEERGHFAVRGGILDVFPATEERAARLELFGDEIETIRWFSTFTQRSLGEAERIELDPAAELALEHRELAVVAAQDGERPDVANLLPFESFRAPLDLLRDDTAIVLASAEEIEPALGDHWEDVTAAIHDDDARRLYVEVSTPLRDRAALSLYAAPGAEAEPDSNDERRTTSHVFRAQAPTSAARTIAEAESQLERELRSGYRVAVTFEHRGEAERAQYNLNRVAAGFIDDPATADAVLHADRPERILLAEARLTDGFVSPDLRLAVIPFRRLVHRRRAAAPAP